MPVSTRDVSENMFVETFVKSDFITNVLCIQECASTSTNVVIVIKQNNTQQSCQFGNQRDHFGQRFNLQRDFIRS